MLEYLILVVEEYKLSLLSIEGFGKEYKTTKKIDYTALEAWKFSEHTNDILKQFELDSKWYDHIYVVIKTKNYTSLQIELPFDDKALIEQTIELQVSEKIPFDIEEFAISYQKIGQAMDGHLFHIGLIPKEQIIEVLGIFKSSKAKPDLITNFSSLLRTTSIENGIIFFVDQNLNYGLVIKDSKPVEDFTFTKSPEESHEIRLRAERYQFDASNLEFNGKIEDLMPQLISENPNPTDYLVNFRTREFSYNKILSSSITILKDLSFPITFCLFGLILFISLNYFSLFRTITSYQSAIKGVLNQFPELKAEGVTSTEGISNINLKLSDELSSLSADSKGTLEYLAAITNSIEEAGGTKLYTINTINITPQRIIIEGSSDSYANVEKLERTFNRLKEIDFCNTLKPNISGSGQTRNFSFTLDLICQS